MVSSERYFRRFINFRDSFEVQNSNRIESRTETATRSLLEGRDVVAVLAGFEKSLIFQMFACVKKLVKEEQEFSLVVSLLKSLMADQIDEANTVKL